MIYFSFPVRRRVTNTAGFLYKGRGRNSILRTQDSQFETVLNRPIFRQVAANFFVLGIVGTFLPQALKRFEHVLLVHLQSIGDHTRGLFEAYASIAVSAAHALKNVNIFFVGFVGHNLTLPNCWLFHGCNIESGCPACTIFTLAHVIEGEGRVTVGSGLTYSGEPNFLRRNQLGCGRRFPLLIDRHAQARKNSPPLSLPLTQENQESIFYHSAWLTVT